MPQVLILKYNTLWVLMKVCLLFGTALEGYISFNQAEHDNDLHTILASFYLWIFCNGSFLCSCTCCLNKTLMLVTPGNVNGSICKSDLYIWILHVNEETRCLKVLNGHFGGDFCGHTAVINKKTMTENKLAGELCSKSPWLWIVLPKKCIRVL